MNIFPTNQQFMCNEYISYLIEYNHMSKYESCFFSINKNNKNYHFLLSIEKNRKKILNFYGIPFVIQVGNNRLVNAKYVIKELKDIFIKKKIDNINLVIVCDSNKLSQIENLNKKNISKIYIQKFINLEQKIEEIVKQFSKGHKHLVKKEYKELNYKIIDSQNYKNEIYQMMKLHHEVSGKVTRSQRTWAINEKMILKKKGFLITVKLRNELISSSFFYFNNQLCEYFSSCTKRNYFKTFDNITHKSILLAIKYLKNIKYEYFTLGETRKIYDENLITIKEKNIHKFKNSFGGKEFIKIYLKNFDEEIIKIFE